MDTREKILSREGLHDVLDEHRRSGRKVVFANGVFDQSGRRGKVDRVDADAKHVGAIVVALVDALVSRRRERLEGWWRVRRDEAHSQSSGR